MLIFGGSVGAITATGAFDLVFDAVIKKFGNMVIVIIPILCFLLGLCGAATVFNQKLHDLLLDVDGTVAGNLYRVFAGERVRCAEKGDQHLVYKGGL